MKRVPSGISMILLILGLLTLAFNVQPVEASETIYIRADGSIEPITANITTFDNSTYYFTNDNYDEIVVERSDITIDGSFYSLQGNGSGNGFYWNDINNVTIKNTNIKGFTCGVYLNSTSNNTFSGNNITNNQFNILLSDSFNTTISQNTISGISSWDTGIYLDHGSNNTISRNNITAHYFHGITLYHSLNNSIYGNNITNNRGYGIGFPSSEPAESPSYNSIFGNQIANNNDTGIYIGKSTNNNTVSGNNVTNNAGGIELHSTNNNCVYGNNITANNHPSIKGRHGIYVYESSNNSIRGNNIKNNADTGIKLSYKSSNNTMRGNNITNNGNGIRLGGSSNNSINDNNIITNNQYGIYLEVILGTYESSSNIIYRNNFIDNTNQIFLSESLNNTWDSGYPSGGNYWDDYTGEDLYRGPHQNITGSDGIGDTPYIIDENNTDSYPLMGQLGPLTMVGENITVFPADDACLIFENVTAEGLTVMNKTSSGPEPPSGFMVDQYYHIETTSAYSGKITIRIDYDDSNMTPEQEEVAQLMQWNETTQEWMNITTYIDTENNVIIGETNHLSMFGVTKAELVNYITITEVTPSKTIVGEGYSITINVTIANQGDMPQTFNITVYANANAIDSKNVTLASGHYTTLTFTWNTTGFAKGNYTVSAYALPVPGETATADNTLVADEEVCVTIPGDVDGDFDVDLFDAVKLLVCYGAKKGSPSYDPNCDINCDGKIDLFDAVKLLTHYGQKDP